MKEADVEVVFNFIAPDEGGRKQCVTGYRPAHRVNNDYLTTGVHHYYDKETVYPGEFVMGTITFISPEYYPKCLWTNKVIRIQEGRRIVGYAEIIKIFNEVLRAPTNVLGYRIYPEPDGTKYYQVDFDDVEKVEQVFNYCQILEATIYKEGWDFLINYFGYETLFYINKKSDWFSSENIDEFKQDIKNYISSIEK